MLSALLLLLSLTIGFLPHLTIEAFRPVYNINIKSRKFRILESSPKNIQQQRSHHQPVLSAFRLPSVFGTVEFRDVLYDDTSSAFDAWEWTSNMGAPAALIAAAVLVTLSETRAGTTINKTDEPWTRFLKRMMRFSLMTSFALEVTSIFVGNMTGSMLLGHGAQTCAKKMAGYCSALQLLHHHFEFEYLIVQISFLQGLIHWLFAVICELLLEKTGETAPDAWLNKCLASWLFSLVLFIMAFYNDHINFYSDYASMIRRFFVLLFKNYRFRPMSLMYLPSLFYSFVLTWKAFSDDDEQVSSN